MKSFKSWFAFVLAASFAVSSCSKDDETTTPPPASGSTTYVGTIGNGSESGSLNFSVDNAGAVTGTLSVVGGTNVSLTGTLNSGTLGMAGGSYTFAGALANQRIAGTYGGPNGAGSFEADQASTTSTTTYCGTYHESAPGTETGTFNMTINNGSIRVMAVESGTGNVTNLDGTLNGSTISLYPPGSPGTIVATGTLNGNNLSGTYNTGSSSGTWSGGPCQ